MPGNSTNVGPGAPLATSSQTVQFRPGDEPALAAVDHMDMSAPLVPMSPSIPAGQVPHDPEKLVESLPIVPPLSDQVAPFKTSEPNTPATEYVPVSVIESIMQPAAQPSPPAQTAEPPQTAPTHPTSVLLPASSPVPSQPLPPSAPAPAPTPPPAPIQSRPQTPSTPASKPVEPPHKPAHRVYEEPVRHPPRIEPLTINKPLPALDIGESAASSLSSPVSLGGYLGAAPQAVPTMQAPVVTSRPSGKSRTIYSHNTRALWHARRQSIALNMVVYIGILILFGGLFVYWMSIGSPTRVEDLPFISSQK